MGNSLGPCNSLEVVTVLGPIAPWTVLKASTHATKVTGGTGALQSGESFEIPFTAAINQRVSFVAMLGQSNDWFFAPKPEGIALYDADGNPRAANVTSEIYLFDAGGEIDQEPAVGDATGPRQPAPDFGARREPPVHAADQERLDRAHARHLAGTSAIGI